jgi:MFS family permease
LRYVREYLAFIRGFSQSARIYMLSFSVWLLAMGLISINLNLFLLRVGHGESLLGALVFYVCMASVVCALPVSGLSRRLGGWRPLLFAASLLSAAGTLAQVLRPSAGVLIAAAAAIGAARCVWLISYGPLLADASSDEERSHLFSLQWSLILAVNVAGSWLGGALPRWIGALTRTAPDAASSLRGAILVGVALTALSAVPVLALRERRDTQESPESAPVTTAPGRQQAENADGAPGPLSSAQTSPARWGFQNPALVAKLVIRNMIGGLGAGLFVPLLNVFMYGRLGASPAQIGLVMAIASALGGVATLAAPLLGRRWGRVRVITVCGLVGLPLLAAQGFAPSLGAFVTAYLLRSAIVNLPGPLFDTFYMEVVGKRERGALASLSNMSWDLSWAVGGWLGGLLMQRASYTLPYGLAVIFLAAAIAFFFFTFRSFDPPLRKRESPPRSKSPGV